MNYKISHFNIFLKFLLMHAGSTLPIAGVLFSMKVINKELTIALLSLY